ncbi:MAG TPA: endolytic transglycosylase MltG [Methylomirabilota bacterium]|nr:endolytic transglycosylase MltG [Methylomirabilota bacterium]
MKKLSFLIVMLLLILGGTAAWWVTAISPVDVSNQHTKQFVVKQGEGVREIANNLKTAGLIRNTVAFFLLVKQLGLDGKIQAGEFYLSPSMTTSQIAKDLQVGTFDTRITIPEGNRAEEIADNLQEHFSSYQPNWRGKLILSEGYLFPDTYSFAKDANIESIIKTMTDNFDKKYASIPSGTRSNLPKTEIVTIASMVEREARFAQDRPLVASVIFNRLQLGMALQLDATVQYALGFQPAEHTWWKKDLTANDLKINSPYNTYANPGLPPGPISNPGLDVLTAVINAPATDYIYYVSDKSGHNHYAKTLQEHNANITKYGLQ